MTTRWLIDFDSVLSDTFGHQISAVNREFGTNYTRFDFTDWHTEKVLKPEHAAYMWGDIFLDYNFQMTCQPIPEAAQTLRVLSEIDDNEFFVVSDRPQSLFGATQDGLDQHIGLDLPLYLTRSPHSKSDQDQSVPTKYDVVYDLGISITVDDAPHHAEGFRNIPHVDNVYLMDTPSNRFIENEGKIIRVYGWYHLLQLEKEILSYA